MTAANSSTPIEIREITRDDVSGFHACLDAVARERRYLALIQAPPLAETHSFVTDSIEQAHPRVVALDGPDLVGWADITPYHHPGMDHVGELGMGVRQSHRGRGIGRALLRAVLQVARARGLEKVELEVFASSRSPGRQRGPGRGAASGCTPSPSRVPAGVSRRATLPGAAAGSRRQPR